MGRNAKPPRIAPTKISSVLSETRGKLRALIGLDTQRVEVGRRNALGASTTSIATRGSRLREPRERATDHLSGVRHRGWRRSRLFWEAHGVWGAVCAQLALRAPPCKKHGLPSFGRIRRITFRTIACAGCARNGLDTGIASIRLQGCFHTFKRTSATRVTSLPVTCSAAAPRRIWLWRRSCNPRRPAPVPRRRQPAAPGPRRQPGARPAPRRQPVALPAPRRARARARNLPRPATCLRAGCRKCKSGWMLGRILRPESVS